MSVALAFQRAGIAMPPGQDDLPYDDGAPLESDKHRRQMTLLIAVLRRWLRHRRDAFVGGNLGLYYSMLQVARGEVVVPDVMVVLGCELDRERKSWVIWEEGASPCVVIELLSDSTEDVDRGRKKQIYARSVRVAEYFLFDPHNSDFEGYRLDPKLEYQPIPLDPDFSRVCAQLGLRLVVWHGVYEDHDSSWLRWAEEDGTLLPTDEELVQAEQVRAEAERARAEAERARAEAERARAEAEQARAEAERARAEAEQARAERLAAQLRAMGITPED